MTQKVIQSVALYPSRDEKIVTLARRQASYMTPLGGPWPQIAEGEEVTAHDQQGWSWTVRLLEPISDPDNLDLRVQAVVLGKREPLPVPPLEPQPDGSQLLRLPGISGHAHARYWRAGDLVQSHGQVWKVRGKPKANAVGSQFTYCLVSASESDWATRPGRASFESEYSARRALGTAIAVQGEWLHVKKLTRRAYGSAEGEHFGYVFIGHGRYVSAEKAGKINERHPPNRLERALREGKGLGRDWRAPNDSRIIAAEPANGSMASTPYMVQAGNTVYHVRPVYDDDPNVTRLALTPKQALALAKALGWILPRITL